MKTIIHYKNGEPYTINDLFINYTDWEDDAVVIHGEVLDQEVLDTGGDIIKGFVDTLHDVLYIEEIDKGCGIVKLHFNPNVEMSVIVDVMTAKQRSKTNRLTEQALLVREVNDMIDRYGIEVDTEHFHKVCEDE